LHAVKQDGHHCFVAVGWVSASHSICNMSLSSISIELCSWRCNLSRAAKLYPLTEAVV